MSRELSIVHVVCAGEVGGAERMLADLAAGPGARHAVALFTPSPALRSFFRDRGLRVIDRGPVSEALPSFLARTLGRAEVGWLAGVMRAERADVAHLHTFGSQVLGTRAALAAGIPVVRTEHSTRVYDDPSCWPFSRWSLSRTRISCAVSAHVRQVALARAPALASSMRVVANGVDLSRITVDPLPQEPPFRFVITGRLEPRKGVDRALLALAHVPEAELLVVGDGASRPGLEALARSLGLSPRVRFLGHVQAPTLAIREAHAALSASRKEGLGLALLEAMAQGRPVVAAPTGGIPEFVTSGQTGWLAEDDSPRSLALAMRTARNATLATLVRLGARARSVVEKRYSQKAMRDGYQDAYRAAVELGPIP